jgi:predicted dehydrogenase
MAVDRIRVGVIGLRFGAQVHVPAFRADPRCIVSAAAGRDAARAKSVAAALEIPVAHTDWRALVADPSLDAVSIAVPPLEQARIVEQAAAAGKHVFCEKPVAATLEDADRALQSARRAGIVHAVDFIFPEIPAWQAAKALLQDGAIGAPRHFFYSWKVQTFAAGTRTDSWKNRTAAGGGARGNFLPHVLYNVEWLLGPLVQLTAIPRPAAAPAFCDCIAHLADGRHGAIAISTDAFCGGGHQLQIFGESGTLVLSNDTADHASGFQVQVATRPGSRLQTMPHDPAAPEGDGRIAPAACIVRRFIDGIVSGTPVTPSLDDGVHVQRWMAKVADAELV